MIPAGSVIGEERHRGWEAGLNIAMAPKGGRTVIRRLEHFGPLTVQRPFYPEDAVCHLYVLHPPGGLVGGDRLTLNVAAEPGARALITTPGATKFYRSAGAASAQEQHLGVYDGGCLEWLPQENIIFDGARSDLITRIDLEGEASFMGWEVICLGRPSAGERFRNGALSATLAVNRDGVPLLHERLRISGESECDCLAGLRAMPVTATFLATGVDGAMLADLRRLAGPSGAMVGLTLMDDLLIARYLGYESRHARRFFVEIWSRIRLALHGLQPCPPRIWET